MPRGAAGDPKAVNIEFISPEKDADGVPQNKYYLLMKQIIGESHEELNMAKIALWWRLNWKPDRNGRMTLAQAKILTDFERDLCDGEYDLAIFLNYEWFMETATEHQKKAVLDHELWHFQPVLSDGEIRMDSEGRVCYCVRQHTVQEFPEVIEKYGLYTDSLRKIAEALAVVEDKEISEASEGILE